MAWWSRRPGAPDPDRDLVHLGEPLGDVSAFDPPAHDGPFGHDPVALQRLLQRSGPVYDDDGTQLLPLVPATLYLAGCHLAATLGQERDEGEVLAVVEHILTRPDVHQVLAELKDHDDVWPHADTLYVITTVPPVQVMAWFRPDQAERLGKKSPDLLRLQARSEVPIGFSVVQCWWD